MCWARHLWRLLSWRLKLFRKLAPESRLPYLREQGTRLEAGLAMVATDASWSMLYRAQYVLLAVVSRLAYGLHKAKDPGNGVRFLQR